MKLFLFLVLMANVMFVLGLLFSVQIRNMAALLPAILSAGIIFTGAYIESNKLPYPLLTQYCLALVGIAYAAWGIYYKFKSKRRPDRRGKAYFLLFSGAVALLACYLVNSLKWPLKFD